MEKIAVIGGGAAGMMAAISAAETGHEVHLFEKNEKLGKKIFITGKCIRYGRDTPEYRDEFKIYVQCIVYIKQ